MPCSKCWLKQLCSYKILSTASLSEIIYIDKVCNIRKIMFGTKMFDDWDKSPWWSFSLLFKSTHFISGVVQLSLKQFFTVWTIKSTRNDIHDPIYFCIVTHFHVKQVISSEKLLRYLFWWLRMAVTCRNRAECEFAVDFGKLLPLWNTSTYFWGDFS